MLVVETAFCVDLCLTITFFADHQFMCDKYIKNRKSGKVQTLLDTAVGQHNEYIGWNV